MENPACNMRGDCGKCSGPSLEQVLKKPLRGGVGVIGALIDGGSYRGERFHENK